MSKRNHYGKMKSPEEAVAEIRTLRAAISVLAKWKKGLEQHHYMVQREIANRDNYAERVRLLEQVRFPELREAVAGMEAARARSRSGPDGAESSGDDELSRN